MISYLFFAICLYSVYTNYNKNLYLYYISKSIGYFNIYKRKVYHLFKSKKEPTTIQRILVNNGNPFIRNTFYNELDYLIKYEQSYKSIEIYYSFNHTDYIILYSSANSIRSIPFPPYKHFEKTNAFEMTSDSIIFLDLENTKCSIDEDTQEEILDFLKQLSGPKGTFYKDIGYVVDKELLINIINKKYNLQLEHSIQFSILYSNGDMLMI